MVVFQLALPLTKMGYVGCARPDGGKFGLTHDEAIAAAFADVPAINPTRPRAAAELAGQSASGAAASTRRLRAIL